MLVVIAAFLIAPLDAFATQIYRRQSDVDAQSSLTLDPKVIQPSNGLTGLETGNDTGRVASLTSKNNFINFCLTQNVALTDGKQNVAGSCNPTPMGRIAAKDRLPYAKIVFPPNLDTSLTENEPFTLKIAIKNLRTGSFVNPDVKYYAAPQTVDGDGNIEGHSHVVIQALPSLKTTEPVDPNNFTFFKGLNTPAQNGILSANVPSGLPAGAYRICCINTSTNHQPVLVSVAQHGSLDDCSYFIVMLDGQGNYNNGGDSNYNNVMMPIALSILMQRPG